MMNQAGRSADSDRLFNRSGLAAVFTWAPLLTRIKPGAAIFDPAKALKPKEEHRYFKVSATPAGPGSASLAKCLSL